jgi:hypothetical protein
LSLDALFEFTSDVEYCFSEGAERTRRKAAADDRMSRWRAMEESVNQAPASVPAAQIDAMLAEYEPGWLKIVAAQKRPKCAFQTAWGVGALLPHAQASRQVARVAMLRTRRALERNDQEAALEDLRVVLRLSRDLRPRGPMMSQLVPVSVDQVAYKTLVAPILSHPGFSGKTSASLLKILREHGDSASDPYTEVVKADYLNVRQTMRDAIKRGPELARELGGGTGDSLFGTLQKLNRDSAADVTPAVNAPQNLAVDNAIAGMTPAAARKDVDRVNRYFRALLTLAPKRPVDRLRGIPDPKTLDSGDDLSKVVLLIKPEIQVLISAPGRDLANLRGTECLVALRRWQVVQKTPPTDLLAVCKAAGLPAVPIDPHSGKPMKMAVVDGSPVVYSIGIDGKDDGGLVDSKFEAVPGDILFRLGP